MRIKAGDFNTRYILSVCIVFFLPFIVTWLWVAFTGNNLFNAAPVWTYGDEVSYYYQIGGAVEYNAPLGYFGYDGTHAEIGTFGPWGVGLLIPYILFGKIFGWGLNAPILANLLFLGIANLCFVIATKCKVENLKYIILVNVFLYCNIIYSISGFCEAVKYSIAIVLAGLLYRLAYLETNKKIDNLLTLVTILFATFMYVPMVAFLIVYLIIVLKRVPTGWRLLLACVVASIVGFVLLKATNLFASPFTAWNNSMDSIISDLGENGFLSALKLGSSLFFDNLYLFLPWGVWENRSFGRQYLCFYITIWFLFLWLLFIFLNKKVDKRDRQISLVSAFLLVVFIGALSFLYGSGYPQTTRAVNVALCAVIFASILQNSRKAIAAVLIFCIIGLPFFSATLTSWTSQTERFLSKAEVQNLEKNRELVGNVIQIQPSEDPWENTVAFCRGNGGDPALMYLPMGVGINLLATTPVNKNAKYVIIGEYADKETIVKNTQLLLENNHQILLETDTFTVLLNKRFLE